MSDAPSAREIAVESLNARESAEAVTAIVLRWNNDAYRRTWKERAEIALDALLALGWLPPEEAKP